MLPDSSRSKRIPPNFSSVLVTLAPAWASITVGFGALLWGRIPVNGFVWALACLAAGSLAGIVFGVPRAASRPEQSGSDESPERTHPNTNMEQISDWLTKILVGAGLVELKELPHNLDLAAHYVAPSLTSGSLPMPPSTVSIAAAIIIFFSIEGFIGGYLIARVLFKLTFAESE
jgi:hypothetical protein